MTHKTNWPAYGLIFRSNNAITNQRQQFDPVTADAISKAVGRALAQLRKTEPLTGVQWADRYFKLSAESSLIKGDWETLSWQVAILNAMTNDDVRSVSVQKSKRTGYTKMILAVIAYSVSHKIRKVGIWQPTDGDAKEFSLMEVDTMIRDVEDVRNCFPYYNKKSSGNTVGLKKFNGAPLYIRGGKSAKNYRRITLDTTILDELDAFDADIENEGGASGLADGRTEGSPFRKQIQGSTPRIKGESQIEYAIAIADKVFDYYFKCPHCDFEQSLKFGGKDTDYGFKWHSGKPETTRYLCSECASLITQNEFTEAIEEHQGRWISRDMVEFEREKNDTIRPESEYLWTRDGMLFYDSADQLTNTPEDIGFHIWAGYSPMITWREIVKDWLRSCRDPLETKRFMNTVLGQTYDIASGDQANKTELETRPEQATYDILNLPERICYITAGVDVQPDRFEIQVIGWGIGAEAWVLEYFILPCDTSLKSSWEGVLDPALARSYPHPTGKKLQISFTGIDTGGHATQMAYQYCKAKTHDGRLALKGMAGDRPIIPLKPSMNWSLKGLKGWIVGVDTAKTQLYSRLNVVKEGEGYIHFPKGLPEDYFDQLTAEKRRLKIDKSGRRQYYWWAPSGARVEALDTFVYAIAALEHSGIDLGLAWAKIMEVQKTLDFDDLAKRLNN